MAPQARKIIFRAAQRIKKAEGCCVQAKEKRLLQEAAVLKRIGFVNHDVVICLKSSDRFVVQLDRLIFKISYFIHFEHILFII